MKEVIVKAQKTQPLFSRKIIVNYIKIIKGKWRANEFNNLCINIDLQDIQDLSRTMYQTLARLCPLDQLGIMN